MKKNRTCLFVMTILLFGLFLQGCQNKPDAYAFFSGKTYIPESDALHSGGSYDGEAILREITFKEDSDGNGLTAQIVFTGANSLPVSQLPKYSINFLENPSRLVLSGNFVGHDAPSVGVSDDVTYCIARRNGFFSAYIQLPSGFVFSVREEQDTLILEIRLLPTQGSDLFYPVFQVSSQNIEDNGGSFNLTPAVSDGKIVYISPIGYMTQEEADTACADIANQYGIPQEISGIAKISGGVLNGGFIMGAHQYLIERNAAYLSADGSPASAAFWVYGAQRICQYDEKTVLFQEKNSDGQYKLVKYAYDGTASTIGLTTARAVAKGRVDSEGNYFACLSGEKLYVFDVVSQTLSDTSVLDQVGAVKDFAWGDDDCVYFTAGESGELSIYRFDPAAHRKGEDALGAKDSGGNPTGRIEAGGGRIYYTCEDGGIWYSTISYDEPLRMVTGEDFILSKSGKLIALLYQGSVAAGEDDTSYRGILLIDIESGGVQEISESDNIIAYCISQNSQLVHYMINDGENEEYPFKLYSYRLSDQATFFHGSLATEAVFTLPEGQLGMAVSIEEGEASIPLVYMLRLNYYYK